MAINLPFATNSAGTQRHQLEQRDCSWTDTAKITGIVLMTLASLALISGVIGYYLAGYTSVLKTLAPVAGATTLGTLLIGIAVVCGSSSKVSIVQVHDEKQIPSGDAQGIQQDIERSKLLLRMAAYEAQSAYLKNIYNELAEAYFTLNQRVHSETQKMRAMLSQPNR